MNTPAWLPLSRLTSPLLRASCDHLPNRALEPDSVSGTIATLQTTPKWLETATISHFSRSCGWLSGSPAVWPSLSATFSWKVKAGLTHVSDRLVELARGQGDSVLPLRASQPAVAGLDSMHDTSGQYHMMAKEKAAPLQA